MKIIFFGSPNFAAKTLSFLLGKGIDIVAVVTKPDRPQGRSNRLVPTPVKQVAMAEAPNIPLFQPERAEVSSEEFATKLAAFEADLFIVVAYGEIFRQHLLDMPKMGCINEHLSILPKYRGAAPIQRSIMEGDAESGVTIMQMVRKLDAGDILKVATVPIEPNMTSEELQEALCVAGREILHDVIKAYENGNPPTPQKQDEALVTFAPKIELEECEIDWNKPAQQIHNLIRGVNPEPGAWCYVEVKGEKKRLKIKRSLVQASSDAGPKTIVAYGKEGIKIVCGEGSLELTELQLEGKKPMTSREFVCGIAKTDLCVL